MTAERPPVVAVLANKGGVGKSTTTWQFSSEAARRGRHVLAIDTDRQADLTQYSGLAPSPWVGLEGILRRGGGAIESREFIRTVRSGLDILPASQTIDELDRLILERVSGHHVLRGILEHLGGRSSYDLAVIDVGHSVALLRNVLAVADVLVVPTPACFPDANHVGDMFQRALDVREELRLPRLDLMTRSVVAMWRRHPNAAVDAEVIQRLENHYGERVFPTVLPNSSHVGAANQMHKTLREYRDEYAPRRRRGPVLPGDRDASLHRLVDAYSDLADFILERVPEEVLAA